jgi:hypothetical protein
MSSPRFRRLTSLTLVEELAHFAGGVVGPLLGQLGETADVDEQDRRWMEGGGGIHPR